MCRMLGVMCNDEDLLPCALQEVRESLRQAEGEHHAGIGIGHYANDDPLLIKRPYSPQVGIDCPEVLKGINSNVLLSHVRMGSPGSWKDSNTHPFRFRRWLFAHVGELPMLDEKRKEILESLPDFLHRGVKGETDSEVAFHLLLDELYKANHINDLSLAADKLGGHLRTCLARIDEVHKGKHPPLAIMVTNGQIMAAVGRGVTLHTSHREGILECGLHESKEAQGHLHGRFRGIMIGAAMAYPTHQWREVVDNSLVWIDKSLQMQMEQM